MARNQTDKVGNKGRLVAGVGINDAEYPVMKRRMVNGKSRTFYICEFYMKWSSMLSRCRKENYAAGRSYDNCYVFPEWIYFSNFKAWMETQDWEGKQLDKDLLVRGNRMYGPETCTFLTQKLNSFIADKAQTDLPVGISKNVRNGVVTYRAFCWDHFSNRSKGLGSFKTPEDGHEAWRVEKLRLAELIAETLQDVKIKGALLRRYQGEVWYEG